MLRLPPLAGWPPDGMPCVTTIGAQGLAGLLASSSDRVRRARALRLLQQEPGLTLGALFAASCQGDHEPRDLFEVWECLAPNLADWLSRPLSPLTDLVELRHWQRALERARHESQRLWQQLRHEAPQRAHTAYLEQLVARGWQWLHLAPTRIDSAYPQVPAWLRQVWHADHLSTVTDTAEGADVGRITPREAPTPALPPLSLTPPLPITTDSAPSRDATDEARHAMELVVALAASCQLRGEFAWQLERKKRESLREFAYGAGHELNNPLAIIAARAQSLVASPLGHDQTRAVASILSQVERAHDMLADLMLYAKPPSIKPEVFDWGKLLASLVGQWTTQLKVREVTVELRAPGSLMGTADRSQMEVLVVAALKNAAQAVDAGGWIGVELELLDTPHLHLRPTHPWLRLAVEDNGPGLDERSREHAFDPFFSGREAGRGLGFGLCKIAQIAHLHSGEARLDRSPRGGCRLVVELPLEPSGTGVLV